MVIDGWEYYNHAAVPACAPHETPDLSVLDNGNIWKIKKGGGIPLLAKWTTDWDCTFETNWWYVIKDSPFDINTLTSKKRYEIKKGKRFFITKKIENPASVKEELYKCTIKSYMGWPPKYRPIVNKDQFVRRIGNLKNTDLFGAYDVDSKTLCGYAYLRDHGSYLSFPAIRTIPDFESKGVNAALIACICENYNDRLSNGTYIVDGERNILHETGFQEYLQKYFGFRKAYCKLHISFRPVIKYIIAILFPFRKLIQGKSSLGHKVKGILFLEELSREYK